MEKNEIRSSFPHLNNGQIYLNHAAISPLSNQVKSSIESFLETRNSGTVENFEEWMNILETTRELISQLINSGGTDRITFMGNTSDALSAVAEGFPWKPGDEIILNTLEFPSNIQPFRILQNRGINIKYLKPDTEGKITAEMIADAITTKTKMVSISAVQYLNGFRADLKAIGDVCYENGVYFIVDGIQALGAVPIDIRECRVDALASGSHKWLMSPMGIGFLYLSEKLAGHLQPYKTGWLSVENPWELSNFEQDWQPVSRHLETGTFNMTGLVGLNASLTNLLSIGLENIHQEILKLSGYLLSSVSSRNHVEILTPKLPEHHAGIVTFSEPAGKDADAIINELKKNQITISAREGYLRISPHYYNTEEELGRALESIFET